ncbi:hypothetical protein K353_00376 [Kitasatospora sp. SolWspMP-SS2h]|uniref:hypothetical protein n=1 Tax=Kitasatospora sp. SolWspMP-SS2h TaxID=1305729 RepID=UPI000DB9917B|nr:hypothetical protein [Kitasatospora sp. SolWspMP-SS2h]RAJ47175.1 hypothetical protein K353_00376 [Kitasatospora sp. SolWspMP-SS2h]
MTKRHLGTAAAALLLAGTAVACGSSTEHTESADIADSAGPGAFAVPAGLTATCGLLGYGSFSDTLGTPTGTDTLGDTVSGTDREKTVDCRQDVAHQANGTADPSKPQGTVETRLAFWRDVDTAKSQFPAEQTVARDQLAKDAATTPVPGVGTEAFRYLNKESTGTVGTLVLVVRQSNLILTVQVTALGTTPFTDQQRTAIFDRMADHAKAALPVVRRAATAPAGS